jgi:hypothetical protein
MKTKILGAVVFAAAAFCATSASAANLITNGGFETGDFTGWTAAAISFPMDVSTSYPVEQDSYSAQIAGFAFGPDTLTQTVATTAGTSYLLSFWRYNQDGDPNVSLDVTWNGVNVFSEYHTESATSPNFTANVYNNFTARVVGTGGSDSLVFTSVNDPSLTFLDNVSLTSAVPEPATWAMMLLGLFGVGFVLRGRKQGALAAV